MSDFAVVEFPGLDLAFNVPSVLAEFTIPIVNIHLVIHWYGVIIAFGFLLAVLLGGRMAYKWKMNLDKMLDVLIYGTFGGIIGARLYYVAFEWGRYKDNLLDIFKIWEGGLAIYGGLIGAVLAAAIVCHFNKLNFWNLLDLAAMGFLIGQGIGRWGNFVNQEAFGTNTTLPWGMTSDKVVSYIIQNQAEFAEKGITMNPTVPVHPTFLYESLWCLLGALVIYIICRKFRKFSGQLILTYGVWYGIERMVVEGLRTDSLYIAGTQLRVSQVLSGLLALVCLVTLIVLLVKAIKNPKPIEGVDYYFDKSGNRVDMHELAAANDAPLEENEEVDENGEDN